MLSYGIDLIGYDNLAKKNIGQQTVWVKETCSTFNYYFEARSNAKFL